MVYEKLKKEFNRKTLVKTLVEVILYISKLFIPVFALGPAVVFVHIDRVIDSV